MTQLSFEQTATNEYGVWKQVQRAFQSVLDLLFPPRCVSCGRIGIQLCPECIGDFRQVGSSICLICGKPQPSNLACSRCRSDPPAFSSVRSAFVFEGGVQRAIHAFKYKGQRNLAAPLALEMSKAIAPGNKTAVLCPVPMHKDRERERGYNQAGLLAETLSALWSMETLPPHAFSRTRATAAQVTLTYAERQTNLQAAFCAEPSLIAGRDIILIDDVCTTGATFHECAQTLLRAGAQDVMGMTLARAI